MSPSTTFGDRRSFVANVALIFRTGMKSRERVHEQTFYGTFVEHTFLLFQGGRSRKHRRRRRSAQEKKIGRKEENGGGGPFFLGQTNGVEYHWFSNIDIGCQMSILRM